MERSQTDRIAVRANGFHCLTTTPSIHLFQNSMDVVSHGKLRKTQVRSDFLICETFGDETNQLLLTQSKIGPGSRTLDRRLPSDLSDETE
jgi:hypothetical protein